MKELFGYQHQRRGLGGQLGAQNVGAFPDIQRILYAGMSAYIYNF